MWSFSIKADIVLVKTRSFGPQKETSSVDIYSYVIFYNIKRKSAQQCRASVTGF